MQVLEPGPATVPAPHDVQPVPDPEYLPAGQLVHEALVAELECFPGGHCVHAGSYTLEYQFRPHATHAVLPAFAVWPAAQNEHHEFPVADEIELLSHVTQPDCLALAPYLPLAHAPHPVDVTEMVPSRQARHCGRRGSATDPALHVCVPSR